MALAPDSLRMASALHSCSRRTAVSLRQYVVCVPRYIHTWPHVRACVRARATSQRRSPTTRVLRWGVCVQKTTVTFSSVVSRVNPYHRSLSVAHVTAADAHRHPPTHTDTHPPITVVNTRAIIKTYITTTINLPTAYLPGRDVYLITKG